jgi:phosphatidylserine/phosphatidylglycerophosphate/cardiolipin synthase-like enzyme
LRDLLLERIKATPSGGHIRWMTYYFRDRELAEALVAASDRGVRVQVCLEGQPRLKAANSAVIERLSRHGLRDGLRVHAPRAPWAGMPRAHLHTKIYAFSHPRPTALVGSFNPSGDEPEDQDVIAEIGDQDRGHNLLVELTEAALVAGLETHVEGMCRSGISMFARFLPGQNRVLTSGATSVFFYPRLAPDVLEQDLEAGARPLAIEGAISHLKRGPFTAELAAAARAGVAVRLLVHDTERRVPEEVIDWLAGAGVSIRRYERADRLPLHAKFLLVDRTAECTAYFGSFNFNRRSRHLNHEILIRSTDKAVCGALHRRFEEISGEVRGAP